MWRGTSRLWGNQTGTVKTPHTASPAAVAASIAPHLQEKSTHVKPTYLLRFSSPPEAVAISASHPILPLAAHRCLPLLLQPASLRLHLHLSLNHNAPSHGRDPGERQYEEKSYSPRRLLAFSPPGRPDRASRNAILDPCAPTAGRQSARVVPGGTLGPGDRRLAEIDPETWVGSRNQKLSFSQPASPTNRPPYWRTVGQGQGPMP